LSSNFELVMQAVPFSQKITDIHLRGQPIRHSELSLKVHWSCLSRMWSQHIWLLRLSEPADWDFQNQPT